MIRTKSVYLTLFAFLIMGGCTKDSLDIFNLEKDQGNTKNPLEIKLGSLYAKYNGERYEYTGKSARLNQHGNLNLNMQINFSGMPLVEAIRIISTPLIEGRHELGKSFSTPPLGLLGLIWDTDVVIGQYDVDTLYNNYILLNKVDTTEHIVGGSFQMRLINISPGVTQPGFTDTVDITNGVFYMEYDE